MMFDGPDRRKEEEKIRSEGRLPPGQSLTLKFPVLHYGPVPAFNPATWDLRVWGEVEQERRWTWDEFNRLPRTQIRMDLHCVTRWSKFDTVWEGVAVRTLIEQGLALLSGGERSLTAAALIFALLRVAPPPFCVLDEVDAALDEANVNRFRDLLSELSGQTQFILITHNRGTVQAAHTLYGVSMQPDSASQVISIKPEEYLSRTVEP